MNIDCTILIPTWNRGDYLVRAVESALSQGENVREIIVVDNHSSEEFHEYLQQVADLSKKVRIYIQTTNIGPTGNWLMGLKLVQTEWVKILFSDDFLEPNCLERMFVFRNKYDLDVVVCSSFGLVNDIKYDFYEYKSFQTGNFSFISQLIADRVIPVSPTAAIFRAKDAIRDLEDFSFIRKLALSAIGPDLFMIYGPVARGGKFGFLNERLVTMFGDGKNISSLYSNLLPGYYAEAFLYLVSTYKIKLTLSLRLKLWYRIVRSALLSDRT